MITLPLGKGTLNQLLPNNQGQETTGKSAQNGSNQALDDNQQAQHDLVEGLDESDEREQEGSKKVQDASYITHMLARPSVSFPQLPLLSTQVWVALTQSKLNDDELDSVNEFKHDNFNLDQKTVRWAGLGRATATTSAGLNERTLGELGGGRGERRCDGIKVRGQGGGGGVLLDEVGVLGRGLRCGVYLP